MLDARTEIEALKHKLRLRDLSETVINDICDEVARDISATTADILADAMNEAVNAGGNAMSVDFIDELRATRSGSGFEITTDSGSTDFSEPPFPMLPKLLKNAKIAKDGSLYKVIPIKSKTSNSEGKIQVTTEAAMNNINSARQIAKEQRDAERESVRGSMIPDPMKGMDTLTAMQSIGGTRQKGPGIFNSAGAVTSFRTASSKQDPSKQWVNPGRKADLSGPLREINMNLHDNIDKAIEEIIRRYGDMY